MKKYWIQNKWALGIGMVIYILFLTFSLTGKRFFDCQSTEKYTSGTNGTRHGTVNHFYHK